jgi:hypothetical protein
MPVPIDIPTSHRWRLAAAAAAIARAGRNRVAARPVADPPQRREFSPDTDRAHSVTGFADHRVPRYRLVS